MPPVALALVALLGSAGGGGQTPEETPGSQAGTAGIRAALERALDESGEPGPAYHLRVDCADAHQVRSLELFPDGVGIWNRRAQFTLGAAKRRELLDVLLREGFAQLAPRYGGRPEPETPRPALRISCQVALEIDGLRRSSMQLADGEQSPELAALAAALLDLVEPLGRSGTVAADLEDGLRKLSSGALAPAGFELRFVELPAAKTEETGAILRLEGSSVTSRAYAPGREIGEPVARELAGDELGRIVAALLEAQTWALPVNLWSDRHLELEVGVLDQRKSVLARRFARLAGEAASEDAARHQARFDRLVEELRNLRSTLGRRTTSR